MALTALAAAEEAIAAAATGTGPVHRLEGLRAVVLVEGRSDRAALRTAARVLGRDLGQEQVVVVAMGGITNLVRFARAAASVAPGVPTAALCDGSEERWLNEALRRIPAAPFTARCDRDLEDELLRALGDERALEVLAEQGEAAAFRVFQGQPAQRARPVRAQLHRFLGVASGRKERLAGPLTAALDAALLPRPFRAVLAEVGPTR